MTLCPFVSNHEDRCLVKTVFPERLTPPIPIIMFANFLYNDRKLLIIINLPLTSDWLFLTHHVRFKFILRDFCCSDGSFACFPPNQGKNNSLASGVVKCHYLHLDFF